MNLYSEELNFAPWKHIALHNFVADLITEHSEADVFVIAIDGRSGGGKSTMASIFDWQDILIEHVLKPLSTHGAVSYQPKAWKHHGREGAIEVPSTSKFVILEGVGAGRRELGRYINKLIWVQSDYIQARLQGIARDGGGTKVEAFWDEWLASERPFLAHQQPWLRADKVVLGVAEQPQLSPPEFIKVSGKV